MYVSEEEIDKVVSENKKRYDDIFGTYNPITGEGCYDFENRIHVRLPDFFIPDMWVPRACLNNVVFRQILTYGTIRDYVIYELGKEFTMVQSQIVAFTICIIRGREDPEFAMYITDSIIDKESGEMIPFKLNYPQRKLLKKMEDLRNAGEPIFIVILKARQWGGSTLSQMYIKWMQDFRHPNGWNALILAQTKNTSKKIKAMYRMAIESQAGWTLGLPGTTLQMSPFENSVDDFVVSDGTAAIRSSTLSIASFENFDSVRGSNFHCAHYSEVAYWKQTPEHDPEAVISSISGGLRQQADNIEIFESTGRGNSGFFYEKCMTAMNPDNNDAYKFLFIPFYFIENDMIPVDDQREFAKWLLENRNRETCPEGYRESGKFFWRLWTLGATFEAINWYRKTRNRYKTHAYMATEAPADEVEAFRNSGNLIFNPYSVDEMRSNYEKQCEYYADVILPSAATDRERVKKSKVVIRNDKSGEMKIWELPNNKVLKCKNRYLVAVDIGGKNITSDYTVMTVLDCKGLAPGMNGKPQVVARWRSHCRHDILAWKAAALAHYYDDALLVIESNTADRERNNNTEGDHFGTIIEQIADYYPNLYQRSSSPEAVTDKVLMTYGFQTNKLTKGWIIDNLIAHVDDQLWEEPDAEMYRELLIYERKDDGRMGNIEGKDNHDDVLMSTAIALWVAENDMDKPVWQRNKRKASKEKIQTEATI
jgi:hypothetical protein